MDSRAYFALKPGGTSSLKQTLVPLAAYSSRTIYILLHGYVILLYRRYGQFFGAQNKTMKSNLKIPVDSANKKKSKNQKIPVSPEPHVVIQDGGHVLQGRILSQTIQTLFDSENFLFYFIKGSWLLNYLHTYCDWECEMECWRAIRYCRKLWLLLPSSLSLFACSN